MKIRCLMGCAAALLLGVPGVHAGQVGNLTTFTAHTPAKADEVNANFNAVKAAVDDNNSEIGNHEVRIKDVEDKINGSAGFLPGALMDQLKGNRTNDHEGDPLTNDPLGDKTGYIDIISNYTPPVNAKAFVQTRCSFDADTANQILQHRIAIRSPAGVVVGLQFYQRTLTPAADISVQNINSDYFDLTAGVEYDFGAYFFPGNSSATPPAPPVPTPKGGKNNDHCSAVVMIFRR